MNMKKWLSALLVLVLLLSVMPQLVMAAPMGYGLITGMEEGQMDMQLASAADSKAAGPALAPGNHERWIDRIDQLPDYAASFYTWLETNARNGGILIDPTQATVAKGDSGEYDTYLHRFHTIKGDADFVYTGTGHKAAAQNAVLADLGDSHSVAIKYATAVYGAFDRDHPEVFWLNGRSVYGYSISYSYTYSTTSKTGTAAYEVELYFYLKKPDFDVRNDTYQTVQAINTAQAEQNSAVDEILSQCPDGSAYEQVRYLNKVLTETNAYNSLVAKGVSDGVTKDAWKGISALTGNTGPEGPVCEGYSRAMMVLCKELGIPCVLSEGDAKSSVNGTPGGHMWNYVKLGSGWYAVDTTWNDPTVSGRETWAVSGYESEKWLLVGSETVISDMPFSTSHVLYNNTTVNSLAYTNGPVLSADAYDPASDIPAEPEIQVPTLKLKAPALEFKDMICVVAFFTAENIQDVEEMGMLTYAENVETVDVSTANHVLPGVQYDEGTARYFATSQGIHAKYLGDEVYLAVYAKLTDGSYAYTRLVSYSAVTYATNQLKNSTNMALKQLVASMLNYGAAAQNYFGYNVENPANASLTEEQIALPEAYRADMVNTVASPSKAKQGEFASNKGFGTRRPAVSFEGAFSINYFFVPNYAPVGNITLYYWNEADFNAVDVLTPENASVTVIMEGKGTGEYRGDIVGIAAKNLSDAVYVAAVYSDGTTTWTSGVLGYSIGAYCSSQAAKGGTMGDLAMATAVYGYHAKAYFG